MTFRAYKATADFFSSPRTAEDIERYLEEQGRRLFVERVRSDGKITDVAPGKPLTVKSGDEIVLGGLFGTLALHLEKVPVSLSTSGGALIAGLVLGWLRSKHPTFGRLPRSSVWLMDNLGLNMFIAVVGISSGPSFVSGFKEVGVVMFLMGIIATSIPLILGMLIGRKVFKFPAAITLGCCAGSRTTTASLGAVQDAIGSSIPAMGYTVTYAIGKTLLILWGVVIVLLMS